MIQEQNFSIERFDFDFNKIEQLLGVFVKDLWPVVYLLSDESNREVYIGETTDTAKRLKTHLKNKRKKRLTIFHLITSGQFNKSATLDIESSLIKYVAADGKYNVLNANLGIANHSYYQQNEYKELFKCVWNGLRSEGVCKHSLEHLDNSDLFKYSPYKSLSYGQQLGLHQILDSLLLDQVNNTIIEGGAGTGKTILAIFLFKLLNSDNFDFNFKEFREDELVIRDKILRIKELYPNLDMALVIPMSSLRNTLKKVFKHVMNLKASMVIGPAEVSRKKYDLIIVDEAHRLRHRVNLGAYFGTFDKINDRLGFDKFVGNELDWILKQSKKVVLFYDSNQSIKPSDIPKRHFDNLKTNKETKIDLLNTQFRVRGGNHYVKFINSLMKNALKAGIDFFDSKHYDFRIFDSIQDFENVIKQRNEQYGLSRMIAGYSWKWISKRDPNLYDIRIDGHLMRWNSTNIDWVNSENAINEVGCIHTTQGYDLNYAGIIFGNEISYDDVNNEIIINEKSYFDINGKQSISNQEVLKDYIVNIYITILLRGIKGTYIYVCDEKLRSYLSSFIPKYNRGEERGTAIKIFSQPRDESIPLFDLSAAAGNFSEVQQIDEVENWINLPNNISFSPDLFACMVYGDSMNMVIPSGSICLFRRYNGGSRNGRIVLVQATGIHDNEFGSGYTVKEYNSIKRRSEEGWVHEAIILKPLSYSTKYENIELDEFDLNNFKVIGFFETVLDS